MLFYFLFYIPFPVTTPSPPAASSIHILLHSTPIHSSERLRLHVGNQGSLAHCSEAGLNPPYQSSFPLHTQTQLSQKIKSTSPSQDNLRMFLLVFSLLSNFSGIKHIYNC